MTTSIGPATLSHGCVAERTPHTEKRPAVDEVLYKDKLLDGENSSTAQQSEKPNSMVNNGQCLGWLYVSWRC